MDIHAPGVIRTRNPSKRAAADPRLRPHGQWDRHLRVDSLEKIQSDVAQASVQNYKFLEIK